MAVKTTKKQYSKLKDEILSLLEEVSLFDDNSKEAQKGRVEKAKQDFFYFFSTYFPHYTEEETPDFHKELIKEIEKNQEIIPVAAPRGFAKSTIVTFAYVMWEIVKGHEGIIPVIMDTKDQAEEQTGRIKIELENNPRITNDFGKFKINGSDDEFFIESKLKIKALGSGQKPRGLKYNQHRPKLVICDDLENDEAVENPARRKKLLNWFLRALYPALHPKDGKIFIIGTILHFDSLLKNLIDSHNGKIFKAIDKEGKSLWEDRFPINQLMKIRENIGEQAFQQEYMNNPLDSENQDFKLEELYFYEDINEKIVSKVGYIDPSLGKSKKADYPAIVIGYRGESGTIYVEDAIMRKVKIDTTVSNIFGIYERHNLDYMGVEFVAFQEVLKNWIDDKSKSLGKYLSIKGYSPRGSKDTRIKSLVPLTQNGTIKFKAKKTLGGFKANNDMTILIEQFINYPKNHDDGVDAVHGLLMMIKKKNSDVIAEEKTSGIHKILGKMRSFRGS